MLCQKCHKNEANIHISDAAGGKNATWHLCGSCAAEELAEKASSKQLDLSKLLQILANHAGAAAMTANDDGDEQPQDEREVSLTCPTCGMTDVELAKGRRVGCADCYETFAEIVGTWLHDLHRDNVHRGTRPGARHPRLGDCRAALDVDVLRLELERAVASEAYERAAKLRDAISKRLQNARH